MNPRFPSHSGLPVINLPGCPCHCDALKGDRERCLASGMDGFVAKPIVADVLFGAIEQTLSLFRVP